jgi:hypothetical protein
MKWSELTEGQRSNGLRLLEANKGKGGFLGAGSDTDKQSAESYLADGYMEYLVEDTDVEEYTEYDENGVEGCTWEYVVKVTDVPELKDCTPSEPSVIEQRGETYGPYKVTAQLTKGLQEVVQDQEGYKAMPPHAQLSIDMILHKVARAVNGGNWEYDDNWVDIAGYSELLSKIIAGENP